MTFEEGYGVFTEQTKTEHALMVILGIAVAHVVYIVTISKVGGAELLVEESTMAMHMRRNALIITSAGSTLYFVAAYTRALGGILLNILYILGVVAITPYTTAIMHGSLPTDLYTQGIFRGFAIDVFPIIIFPSFVAPILMLGIWPLSFRLRKKTFWEWFNENLPY